MLKNALTVPVHHNCKVAFMPSILDPSFRYTSSVETDLRKTFARVRREMRRQQQQEEKMPHNVQPLRSGETPRRKTA
jgi:hypothetical protein